MEKKTVLAIVLSALVYLGFYLLNVYIYPPKEVVEDNNNIVVTPAETEIIEEKEPVIEEDISENEIKDINIVTDLYNVTFNTKGANISSLKLLKHNVDSENDVNVDLVLQEIDNNALMNISLGNYSDPAFNEVFKYNEIDSYTHEFSRTFTVKDVNGNNSSPLTLVKTYKFIPDDYMFELKISIKNSENTLIPINNNGTIYSLNVAKQIGPDFKKLGRYEYRRVSAFIDGKRKVIKPKKSEATSKDPYKWTAIEGKFFTIAVVPENLDSYIHYSNDFSNKKQLTDLTINRSSINSSFIEDTYKIYAGPKDHKLLKDYNESEKNRWNMADLDLDRIIHFTLRPLAMFFKSVLEILNKVINNYGLSIIILTIFIKLILYPFTKKSIDSMGKMQTIQPEIKKLQEKYKDDSAKLNAAMADLYKKEGVNPLGGCLPMLLQMPIFITFYSLFNEYIGLRGAVFIPGWINDLSKPESIFEFGFELPFLGWDALRLLPIIYVASQLISMKFSQNKQAGGAQGASAMQTKMLTLGMPIMFFFIMYNQSSGLLLYWITQNLITSVQQIFSKKKSDKEHELQLEEKANKKKKKGRK